MKKITSLLFFIGLGLIFIQCGEDEKVLSSDSSISFLNVITKGTLPARGTKIDNNTYEFTVFHTEDLTDLEISYSVEANSSGRPASGTSIDFSDPLELVVTAQDGSTQIYTITVRREFTTFEIDSLPNPSNFRLQLKVGQEIKLGLSNLSTKKEDYEMLLSGTSGGSFEIETFDILEDESAISFIIPEIPSDSYSFRVQIIDVADLSDQFFLLNELPEIIDFRDILYTENDGFDLFVRYFDFIELLGDNYSFSLVNESTEIMLSRANKNSLRQGMATLFPNEDISNRIGTYKLKIELNEQSVTSIQSLDIIPTPEITLDPVSINTIKAGDTLTLTGSNFYFEGYREYYYSTEESFQTLVILDFDGGASSTSTAEFVNEEGTQLKCKISEEFEGRKIIGISVSFFGTINRSETQAASIDVTN